MKNLRRLYNSLINGESPKLVLILFPLITLLLFLTPMIFTLKSPFGFNFSDTGEIGDTIGGIVGPFIAVIAALLTFLAFWVQYKSNKAQTAQFNKQATKESQDRFETVFFELLKLHRDNVSDIVLTEAISGRNAFNYLYAEYRFHYFVLKALPLKIPSTKSDVDSLSEVQCMDISYRVFFMGYIAAAYSFEQGFLSQYKKGLIKEYLKYVFSLSKDYTTQKKVSCKQYDDPKYLVELSLPYHPFSGHVSSLGHYYRHLFQIVKYVDETSPEINIDKYKYVKILRAQLSSHEQLMLFYNSLSSFGEPWISQSLISDYCFLKNIPFGLANFGTHPRDIFEEKNKYGKYHFEWDEKV